MALWIPDFPSIEPEDLHIIMASNDFLVDVPACVDYLEEEGVKKECITVMQGYQHGQNLFLPGDGMRIVCEQAGLKM